jgi:enoyl-CoA hydratase
VKVIILAGAGKDFSAGHDLSDREELDHLWSSMLAWYDFETKYYIDYCLRWRDIPKPTIAQVQGNAIIAGLMIAMTCDLIVAADNAVFQDHAARWGALSAEFFSHPWDLGIRKSKEFLFTGHAIDAQEAHRLGLVNKVVPLENLEEETMALAKEITKQDPFFVRMAKAAINGHQDTLGFRESLMKSHYMHMLCHARAMIDNEPEIMGKLHKAGTSLKQWLQERDTKFK